jgi:hypothetical protein
MQKVLKISRALSICLFFCISGSSGILLPSARAAPKIEQQEVPGLGDVPPPMSLPSIGVPLHRSQVDPIVDPVVSPNTRKSSPVLNCPQPDPGALEQCRKLPDAFQRATLSCCCVLHLNCSGQ